VQQTVRGPNVSRITIWAALVIVWLIAGLFPGPRGWDALALGDTIPAALLYWVVYCLVGLAGLWFLMYAFDPYPPPEHDEILHPAPADQAGGGLPGTEPR
jgi:uncharacterized membrane protein YuzA (DUF378 family)